MGWETRKRGGRYYTRSRKVGGRVVREYVGGGLVGELASMMDAEEREEREAAAKAMRAKKARLDEVDGLVDSIWTATESLVNATLGVAGFHRHKGEWRRRRGRTDGGSAGKG